MGKGQFSPGEPLAGPPRGGPVVAARLAELKVGRVFYKGEPATNFALFENADEQPFFDQLGKQLGTVKCSPFGRSDKKVTEMPFTRPGAKPGAQPVRVCKQGSKALLLVELLKSSSSMQGSITVTPKLLNRDGTAITHALKTVTQSFKADNPNKEFLIDVDLGVLPKAVGLHVLELEFDAKPGSTPFKFTKTTTQQFVLCTQDDPLDPTKDTATTASDIVSGTPHRMGKLMSVLPKSATDLEDILWRIHFGINDSTPPTFFNKLGVEITHNGDLKRFFDGSTIVNSGHPLPLIEQWLMWFPATGSPPFNHAACAGFVQLLKTMSATLGINVRRTLCLPCTRQMPPKKPGDPMPALLPLASVKLETPMVIAPRGLEVIPALQKVDLVGPDGKIHTAHPALMEPKQSGEFFEACAVTPAGKYLPGGFAAARLEANGVPDWQKGPSGKMMGGGFKKAQRGFDSAADVIRWWTSVKTQSGFQRFLAWVLIEDGALKFCWDVEGRPFLAKDYEKIRDSGKQLPPP